jgi:oligopeptide/dipeptide ABC transporter ATP-binding protein
VMVMYAGTIVESAAVERLFERPRHPYTEALLAASAGRSAADGPLPTIEGSVPLPGEVKSGCRFRMRCPYALERCAEPVALGEIEPGHLTACVRADELWPVRQ